MRVIAGMAGGRKLQAPRGSTTRPTPDRVKEALFSMLAPTLPQARVLDLFAGSGALGIEALSRGARHATFVEQDKAARAVLAHNLTTTGLDAQAQSTVLPTPVQRALAQLGQQGAVFHLILLDPPYAADLVAPTLALIAHHGLLAPSGTVVAEHSGKSPSPQPPEQLRCTDLRRYGDVALSFYAHAHEAATPEGGPTP